MEIKVMKMKTRDLNFVFKNATCMWKMNLERTGYPWV